jgi:hypothetical protein
MNSLAARFFSIFLGAVVFLLAVEATNIYGTQQAINGHPGWYRWYVKSGAEW